MQTGTFATLQKAYTAAALCVLSTAVSQAESRPQCGQRHNFCWMSSEESSARGKTFPAGLPERKQREAKQELIATKSLQNTYLNPEKPTQSSDTNTPDNIKTAMPKNSGLLLLSATS